MIKFPKIGPFRQIINRVKTDHAYQGDDDNGMPIYKKITKYPIIKFYGSVKLHGTNGSICYQQSTNKIWIQSRERVLDDIVIGPSIKDDIKLLKLIRNNDNQNFAEFCNMNKKEFMVIFNNIYKNQTIVESDIITLYGEWCGKGVQKKVGISRLDKLFVIFDVKITTKDNYTSRWMGIEELVNVKLNNNINNKIQIYNIYSFQSWSVDIDFNFPKNALENLMKITKDVENECPVAKYFGITGIGEGVVWVSREHTNGEKYRFKVKGKLHRVTATAKSASISPPIYKSIDEFIQKTVTENRLNQGIDRVFTQNGIKLTDIDMKYYGKFIKWVINDINDEESDVMSIIKLKKNEIGKIINNQLKMWFVKKYINK
jgi:hypothetical protein